VVFGATMLIRSWRRIGDHHGRAALIGLCIGEMLVTDPVVLEWFKANAHWMIDFELFTIFVASFELSWPG